MSLRDRDLVSIQEARELVAQAAEAQKRFAVFSQQQVDAVVEACSEAAQAASEQLSRLAVEETGFGNVADKMTKNRLAAVEVLRVIRPMKTVGILHEDREKGILEVATPVGVVAAVIPSTNPTSTAIYKTLISLKARNAVVLSPHPTAVRCIRETAEVMKRAALKVGAPQGLIACAEHPTLQGTQELMRQRDVGVILATGGTGLVRAAYSSGKPAFGVGPGNVPAYIERTANVRKAVADIFAGKTFDYGTICSSEQAIVAEEAIAEQALEECRSQGAYFLTPDEAHRLGEIVITRPAMTPNPKIVGRPATVIAETAGIKVPASARVLIARLGPDEIGREHPLSLEKLSPILAFYVAPSLAGAIELCNRLLHFGGTGHTIAIHSQNEAAVREFGQAVPAFRVCVNTSAVHGSIGYSTNLFPAMTLGCGALGGNITSDNIGPQHLMNIKRIAWESRPVEHRTVPAEQRMAATGGLAAAEKPVAAKAASAGAGPTISRDVIGRIVERVFRERGIVRGTAVAQPASTTTSSSGGRVGADFSPPAPAPAVQADAASTLAAPADTPGTGHVALGSSPAASPSAAAGDGSLGGRSFRSDKADARREGASAPEAMPLPVVPFVSENDVRVAMTRGERIFIGPKTILTPSARDLGFEHEVFIETQTNPA